jgi:hypothetical protein
MRDEPVGVVAVIQLPVLVLNAAFAVAAPNVEACRLTDMQEPALRVEVKVDEPKIDHSLARARLKTFDIATASPYGNGADVHVNGLMRGAITLQTNMTLAWQGTRDGSINCFWYNRVNLDITLKPTIYVAKEIIKDTCMYREVLNHEYKHYDVDYALARDYQVIFQDEVERFLKGNGIVGPVTATQKTAAQKELANRLERTIQAVNDRMKADRIKRQSLIDTRAEYERVVKSCAGTPAALY